MRNLIVIVAIFLGTAGTALAEEGVTLVTYYPMPQGEHEKLSSQKDTFLAVESGKVGIGTTEPAAKLDVRGDVKIEGPAAIGTDLVVGESLTTRGMTRAAGGLRIQNTSADDAASVGSLWLSSD